MSTNYEIGEAGSLGVTPERIADFIRREWKRPLALARVDFYTWQFVKAPHNNGVDRCIVMTDPTGEVCGFLGLNVRPFWLDGQEILGAEMTTWIIAGSLKGKGYAPKMIKFVMTKHDVMIGSSVTADAMPVYTRLGWRFIRALPRYVRVIHPEKVIALSSVAPLGVKLIRQYAAVTQEVGFSVEEVELSEGLQETEDFGTRFNGFSRSSECLAWRYAHHPVYEYKGFRVQKEGASAVVVLRVDQSEQMNVVHVIDVLGDEEAFPSAASFVDGFSREAGADIADFSCMTNRVGYMFWRAGWFSVLDDESVQVPNLFYPLEIRNPPTSSIMMWAKNFSGSVLDRSQLYLTKGDFDMDRPTQAYFDLHGK